MGLWGASDATEDQPKHFTTEEKEDIVANEHGWTVKAGSVMTGNDNTAADPEILVFIRGLDNKLGLGDITGMDWNISTFDKSAGGTLSVTVSFNEAVTVTGTPQLTVTNDTNSNHTLSYASGSGTNALTFTLVIAAANAATDAGDVLSIAANAMSLNSGTILDTSGDSVSAITAPEATVGSTTFPTVAINNGNATFATTAAVGAVTAKLFSFTVTTAGTGYTDGEDATIDLGTGTCTSTQVNCSIFSVCITSTSSSNCKGKQLSSNSTNSSCCCKRSITIIDSNSRECRRTDSSFWSSNSTN